MWVNVGLFLLRFGARFLLWLAPFLAVGAVRAYRRYRWPVYYRLMALKPGAASWSDVPRLIGLIVLGLLVFFVVLLVAVRSLAPA
jgi:hypothetical protein